MLDITPPNQRSQSPVPATSIRDELPVASLIRTGEQARLIAEPENCWNVSNTGRATNSVEDTPCEPAWTAPTNADKPEQDEIIPPAASLRSDQYAAARERALLCQRFHDLTITGEHTLNEAAFILGKSPSWFSGANSPYAQWLRGGEAALLPAPRARNVPVIISAPDGRTAEVPDWFIPIARLFWLSLNANYGGGSTPEALRRAMSLPNCPPQLAPRVARAASTLDPRPSTQPPPLPACPPELREVMLARERIGQTLLPASLMRQIPQGKVAARAIRSPRNAWLDYVQSPGSLMLQINELTGQEEYIEPGEMWTIDDGTINFACTVPLTRPGDKCWEKFGVMVGRFQFLLIVDHRSYYIPGFSYTARPRSSYRAEDLTATMHTAMIEHGAPKVMILEKGISAANLVTDTLARLDVKILRASNPHQKIVELIFNKLWTKLSLMPGQVGRFRGEEEETNRLLTSCRAGATDPRKYFPSLNDTLAALRIAITEHNASLINGRYGRWTPQDWFQRDAIKHLRPLAPESAWMFSPVITRPLTVRGYCVSTTVNYMPGYSQKFSFEGEFLERYQGAKVKLHFNPLAPECIATVVLAHDAANTKAGAVLGHALQFDREASYVRRQLQYGLDADIGRDRTRRHALALHRHAQAIRPGRDKTAAVIETRDGLGGAVTVQRDGAAAVSTAPTPVPPPPRTTPATERQRQNRSRQAAIARQLLQNT